LQTKPPAPGWFLSDNGSSHLRPAAAFNHGDTRKRLQPACSSAETAELVLASTGTELVALVADVNPGGPCPVCSGQYAKRSFPHLNVVMISGNNPPCIPQDTRFFLKPYRSKELLETALA